MASFVLFRAESLALAISLIVVLMNIYRVDLSMDDHPISLRLREFHSQRNATVAPHFTVDILSISSVNKLELLTAQQRTFATHVSVRNFFNATERDDADPDCYKFLTWEAVTKISTFCRGLTGRKLIGGLFKELEHMKFNPQWSSFNVGWMCAKGRTYSELMEAQNLTLQEVDGISRFCQMQRRKKEFMEKETGMSPVFRFMKMNYARPKWLEKKANPSGWMCAQGRPYSGLMKVQRHYAETKEEFPDYLLILDDDTYFNMELFQQNFAGMDASEALFYAGCLIRHPMGPKEVNITNPFGGFGSILSRGALRNLFRPILCPAFGLVSDEEALANEAICNRLVDDLVWERQYFRNGMSIVDLMHRYVSAELYRRVEKWKTGYCMHSDWLIGYFANYYNVSQHVAPKANIWINRSPHARIEAYKGSQIYDAPTGICNNEGANCKEGSEICHRATPQWMENETNRWKLKVPHRFKSR